MHDALTGAFNRKTWEQEQRKLLRQNIPFSVIMLDIDDCNAEDLFRNADNALYHVKNSGKNGWHIYKGINS